MRYPQTPAESAELLRLSLPLISRHGTGYHPVSFAVWYEYVAGRNAAVREQLGPLVEDGGRLDEAQTYAVYQRAVLEPWGAKALQVNDSLSGLIEEFSVSTTQVDGQLRAFGTALVRFNQTLDGSASGTAPALPQMQDLLAEGQQLQEGLGTLHGELLASQGEIARLQQELRKLEHEVLTDPLTGLYNRRGLDRAFLREGGSDEPLPLPCSVMMVDIDNFKQVNDQYGHLFGDQVIRGVAGALRTHARHDDLVARYGGEEFVLVMPGLPLTEGHASAERIRAHVARSVIRRRGTRDVSTRVTVSAGVSQANAGESLEHVVSRADTALYMAKSQGRNQVVLLA